MRYLSYLATPLSAIIKLYKITKILDKDSPTGRTTGRNT